MSSSLPYECQQCGATYNGQDAAEGCCGTSASDDGGIEAFVRGKDSFVLEGGGCEEWIKAEEAVPVEQ